jgi:hypothetical protein
MQNEQWNACYCQSCHRASYKVVIDAALNNCYQWKAEGCPEDTNVNVFLDVGRNDEEGPGRQAAICGRRKQKNRRDLISYTPLMMTVGAVLAVGSILYNQLRMVANQCLSQRMVGRVPEPRHKPSPTQKDSGRTTEQLSSWAGARHDRVMAGECCE